MRELSEQYGLRVANVFHAGDGNLHPLILYDANKPGELERAEAFGADILRLCVEVGGVLTGEHGVGVEKRDLMPAMFSRDRSRISSSASNARSTRRACSIPARCSRRCTAAPSSAACMCMPGAWRFRTFRGFDHVADTLKPRDGADVEAAVGWALAEAKTLEIVGHGTKRGIGRAAQWDMSLDLSGLSGVTLYEPEELVLSAKAGTPLAEIEALLAAQQPELAFEPMDYGPLLGGAAGQRDASAACSPPTCRARAASRPAPRAIISSASRPCRAGPRPSSPAAAW